MIKYKICMYILIRMVIEMVSISIFVTITPSLSGPLFWTAASTSALIFFFSFFSCSEFRAVCCHMAFLMAVATYLTEIVPFFQFPFTGCVWIKSKPPSYAYILFGDPLGINMLSEKTGIDLSKYCKKYS